MHTLKEFMNHLDATLDQYYRVGFCVSPVQIPPRRTQINAVKATEKRMGITFSPEYREFLHSCGGVYIDVKPDIWPRPTNDTMAAWEFAYGLQILGTGGDVSEEIDIEVAHGVLLRDEEFLPFPLYPVFETVLSDGSYICLDNQGFAFEWDPVWPSDPDPLEQTFFECMVEKVSYLAERKREMAAKHNR